MEAIYRPSKTARSCPKEVRKTELYIYTYIHFSKLTKFDSTCESK